MGRCAALETGPFAFGAYTALRWAATRQRPEQQKVAVERFGRNVSPHLAHGRLTLNSAARTATSSSGAASQTMSRTWAAAALPSVIDGPVYGFPFA
jgi:hypothetical protein